MVGCALQKLAVVIANQDRILERQAQAMAAQATILAKLDKLQTTADMIDAAVFQPDQAAGISLAIKTQPVAPAETQGDS